MRTLLLSFCLLAALQSRANVVTLQFTALNQPVQEVYVNICDTLKIENTSGYSYMLWNDSLDFSAPGNDPVTSLFPDSLTGNWGYGDGYFFNLYDFNDGKAYLYHQISHLLFIIHIQPYAEHTITETICNGASYFFNGQELTESGLYSMQVSTGQDCDSIIHLELTVAPPISSSTYATICPGENYEFAGNTYDQEGIYPHQLATAAGCDSMAYLYLFVSDQPEPQVAYIGDLTLSCSNWGNGYTISWFDCETQTEIPGENDQVFVGEPGGQYAVISTYYGCTDTSECYTIQTAATDELTQNNFTVAPNPANDQISVTLSADFSAEEYTLFQLDGKLIATGKLTAPLTVISIDHVPNGPYLLRINGQYLRLLKN